MTAARILVDIESPYAGATSEETEANLEYARKCVADSLARGESPIASHLLYTQPGILDDAVPEERHRGIEAGKDWALHAGATAVYVDRGISRGMVFGILAAQNAGRPVIFRALECVTTDRGKE